MPYSSNSDLPDRVKSNLPNHAQSIFRRAYNSAHMQNKDYSEERLMRIAWGAVKNAGYKKGEDGKWIKESLNISYKVTNKSWENNSVFIECIVDKSEDLILSKEIELYELSDNFILSNISENDNEYIISALSLDNIGEVTKGAGIKFIKLTRLVDKEE